MSTSLDNWLPDACIAICWLVGMSLLESSETANLLSSNIASSPWSVREPPIRMVLMRVAHVRITSYALPGKQLTQGRAATYCVIGFRIRRYGVSSAEHLQQPYVLWERHFTKYSLLSLNLKTLVLMSWIGMWFLKCETESALGSFYLFL